MNRFGVQVVRLKPTDENMTVHAFTKGIVPAGRLDHLRA